MKLKDGLWILILALIISILIIDVSRDKFIYLTNTYPYLMGFVKTAVLATMGELLAMRIVTGRYKTVGTVYKFIIWGFIGMSFALIFQIFPGGVASAQSKGLLPLISTDELSGKLLFAFLTSLIMNLVFAPTFMALHRITDTYIDLGEGKIKGIVKVKLDSVINKINWNYFISFVVFKTLPIFWVPAHTITFLLREEYRVLMAAFLSIALGIILSVTKVKKVKI